MASSELEAMYRRIHAVIRKIRNSLVKGVLDRLDQIATDKPDVFKTFTAQFGPLLKEGVLVDPSQRERLAKLLRFASSHSEDPEAKASLEDYLGRIPENQKRIYYLGGPDHAPQLDRPSPTRLARAPNGS